MHRITDVTGILVGHTTDTKAGTGCTVLLGPEGGMRAGVFIRGRATGTRELDALSPGHLAPVIHAILLTGLGPGYSRNSADRWLCLRTRSSRRRNAMAR